MSIPDHIHCEPLLSARSCAHFGLLLLVLDSLHIGFSLLARSFARHDLAMSAFSLSRLDFFSPVSDAVHFDLSIFLRSTARSGFAPLVLDLLHIGPMPLARSPVRRLRLRGDPRSRAKRGWGFR